jgi:hypothetical protein
MPGPVSESYSGPMDPEEVQLRAAIRTFTVDMPGGEPNGETERQIECLMQAMDPRKWRKMPQREWLRLLSEANGAAAAMCEEMAKDCKSLRLAAEAYFGGNFRRP